ncbi:MAG: radical SAM family heme chaperone HemW [bacterium]|nr:radical SAM family heme chaperone HemW [bacterium]
MANSAYIHIPFCKSKCKYCSFVSYNIDVNSVQNDYFSALKEEITFYYKKEPLKTIYIGGGTPSLLSYEVIEKIINLFNYSTNPEITLELNPDDANKKYLSDLKSIGINRLSIGAQTFDDKILEYIGRRHNSKAIYNTVNYAQEAGFENISLDLIYGLPYQTLDALKNDLKKIESLAIQHISTYGLKIEDNSYFGKYKPNNLPDNDNQADMYIYLNNYLLSKNYTRYEISNFAIKGFESKHNLNYWNNEEYYGFGVSAHGYNDKIRYSNHLNIPQYLKNPLTRDFIHEVTPQEQLEEEIFLGFRKADGISTKKIYDKYGVDFEKKYKSVIDKFSPEYLKKTTNGYCLTLKGVMLSNIILSEFLET